MSTQPVPGRVRHSVTVIRGMRPRRPKHPIAAGLATLAGALFAGVMLSCIVSIAIWPGEAKLLEPFLCTDARPDAVVVYDTYNPSPGETVTDFSLYCMGPNGDVTSHGWGIVFVWLTLFHTALVLALFALGWLRSRLSRRDPTPPPGDSLITPA